jgi:hypothetical protein
LILAATGRISARHQPGARPATSWVPSGAGAEQRGLLLSAGAKFPAMLDAVKTERQWRQKLCHALDVLASRVTQSPIWVFIRVLGCSVLNEIRRVQSPPSLISQQDSTRLTQSGAEFVRLRQLVRWSEPPLREPSGAWSHADEGARFQNGRREISRVLRERETAANSLPGWLATPPGATL